MRKYMCPFEDMSSTFAERVKWLRENEGLSLGLLAKATGITKPHLWEMEKGNSDNPCLKTLRALANFYEIPCAALIETKQDAKFRNKKAKP